MKVEKIRLVNFGNHADTDIQLKQINVFCGSNGAGKSTIKQALEYLLAGRVHGVTDAAGRGYESLISIDSDKKGVGYVGAVVDGLNISREIGGKIQGMGEPPAKEVVSALLNTSRFLELPQKEQQALLFSLLGFSFSKEKLGEHLRDWPGAGEKETETFGRLVNVTDGGPEVFEKIYKLFYSERTAVKRVLKELEAQAKESSPVDLPGKAWDSREQICSDLRALKEQQKDLIKRAGAAQGAQKRRQTVEDDIARLEGEKQTIEETIVAVLSAGDAAAEKNTKENVVNRLAVLREEQQNAGTKLQEKRDAAAVCQAEVNQLQNTLGRINSGAGRCPIFLDAECSIDWKTVSGDIEISLQEKTNELQTLDNETEELTNRLAEIARETEEGRRLVEEQQKSLWEYSQAQKQLQGIEERLGFFRKEQEELAGLVDVSGGLAEEIDRLGERIAKGDDLAQKLAVFENQMVAQKNLLERLHQVREEVNALEKLVEAFGPAGIRAKLLDESIDRLQAQANERFQFLTGEKYRMKFVMPDFTPVMEKNGVPVRKFSAGERFLLGVVMQDVLAGLAGIRLLVIDDVNHLDQKNKNALMGMLLKVRDDYDTVMIFSALGEIEPKNPDIEGLGMYLVEDGKVVNI